MADMAEMAWERVMELARAPGASAIRPLMADPARAARFTHRAGDILADLSKTSVSDTVRDALLALARERHVLPARDAMARGEAINTTEGRAVLHIALRGPRHAYRVGNEYASVEVHATLDAMRAFCERVHEEGRFTDVVNIGIGGSDLGPQMAARALWRQGMPMRVHYLSNVDGHAWEAMRHGLDPARTLVLVASKTFTTAETMANAHLVRGWLRAALGDKANASLVALSTNLKATREFGVPDDQVFGFRDWVGGRFSMWSAIGLSIALACGWEEFAALLAGARKMDEHFLSAPEAENLPLLMALTEVWHVNGLGYPSRAVLPYDDRLARFPAHLQQVEMESLGKRVTMGGMPVPRATGPVVFGEPGTNSQHSFMQLLHQGTTPVPADIVLIANPDHGFEENHRLLLANGLAQAEALLRGRDASEVRAEMEAKGMSAAAIEALLPHRLFPGNRPSATLVLPRLDANTLGQLVALYEHKVFCLGALWNVNAFDQWGVELGKQLAGTLLPELAPGAAVGEHDPSTTALIAELHRLRGG
ncbi:glucose-6-phosphate isomerase [Roseomonas xinghualingensis]|uniref:glucose-6-phosphate isomerase n=1 Tax=Roseomonas xinghualingensis TaxID=2986475 RepID=UPI0021F139E4|nr:glucose-6-phosphate isomerase [Roseomonas sp. SXEYE001]MCV4208255.1 glucose-6-phosphate isomerase [Roseomonas sp. SXEYE001]